MLLAIRVVDITSGTPVTVTAENCTLTQETLKEEAVEEFCAEHPDKQSPPGKVSFKIKLSENGQMPLDTVRKGRVKARFAEGQSAAV